MMGHPSQRTEQARAYVRDQRGRLPELARETGVNIHWLYRFGDGTIRDPAGSRVDALLNHQLRHQEQEI